MGLGWGGALQPRVDSGILRRIRVGDQDASTSRRSHPLLSKFFSMPIPRVRAATRTVLLVYDKIASDPIKRQGLWSVARRWSALWKGRESTLRCFRLIR